MKLLIIFLICFSVQAGNYVKKSDLDAKLANCELAIPVYTKMSANKVMLPKGFNCKTFSEQDIMVDDLAKPNWGTRSKIGSCEGEADCKTKSLALNCADNRKPFYNEEYSEVWCNKILSYQKKWFGRHIAEDASKKSAHLATINQAKLAAKNKSDEVKALKLKLKSGDLSLIEINELLRKMK